MFALVHIALQEGLSGREMLDRAEEAGVTYGSDELKDAFIRYVDERRMPHRANEAHVTDFQRATSSAGITEPDRGRRTPALPGTVTRVRQHTTAQINRRIDRQIARNVHYFARHSGEINDRLAELDQEWDIERALEANASSLALIGIALGATVDRRFLILPALVTGFLLQHALQRWCPPVRFFRKRGFRTGAEIERERHALKALRGDFDRLAGNPTTGSRARADAALDAIRT